MMAENDNHTIRDFHQNNYNQKLAFLTQHLTRMWTRFNIFMVAQTAIFSGRVFFSEKPQADIEVLMIIGLIVSLVWYVIGAQDKYLVDLYRNEARESFEALINTIPDLDAGNITYAGQADAASAEKYHKVCNRHVLAWHATHFSTTTMASIVPLVLASTWIGLLLKEKQSFDNWWLIPGLLIILLMVDSVLRKVLKRK